MVRESMNALTVHKDVDIEEGCAYYKTCHHEKVRITDLM